MGAPVKPAESRRCKSSAMKVQHTALALEACAVHREVWGKALSKMRAGPVLSRESILTSGCRRSPCIGRHHVWERDASTHAILRGQRPGHVRKLFAREPGGLCVGHSLGWSAPGRMKSPTPVMYDVQKSDSCVLAMKPANKSEGEEAEWVERRRGDRGEHKRILHVPDSEPGERVPDIRLVYASWHMSVLAESSRTQGRSRVREFRTLGSVRGAPSNGCPYRK